jgi:uncharacterized protein (DUF2267 family)
MQRCEAKTRRGGTCRNRPVRGRARCRMHGGASPRGVAHPSFRTGKYSRSLPDNLAAQYEASRFDPNLKLLDDELALNDAMIVEELTRRSAGDARLTSAVAVFQRLTREMDRKDVKGVRASLTELGQIFDGAPRESEASRDRLAALIDLRRRLVSSEAKRVKAMGQIMTNQQVMTLVGALVAAIKAHVSDPVVLGRISDEFTAVLNGAPRRGDPALAGCDPNAAIMVRPEGAEAA